MSYKHFFTDFKDKIWLNAASEGPLPLKAQLALKEAVEWKSLPYQLGKDKFTLIPRLLREEIADLLNVSANDVIITDSASYGLYILANGLPWQKGDEIIVMQNDFPTNIVPWLGLKEKGVTVKQLRPKENVLTAAEFKSQLTGKTRLFCISHVHTFTGIILDINGFAKICKDKNIIFVVNISQSAGTMPIDVAQMNADMVVCAGYKWLCGPYGTGFCWLSSELRKQLRLNRAYWASYLTEEELKSEDAIPYKEIISARKYDMFGTANFFNNVPFRASLKVLSEIGWASIREHNLELISHFQRQLDDSKYIFISPKELGHVSNLVVISHKNKNLNARIFEELKQQGIYLALWKGNLRASPHIYNTQEELDRVIKLLNDEY